MSRSCGERIILSPWGLDGLCPQSEDRPRLLESDSKYVQLFVQKICLVPALGQEVHRLLHCPLAVSSHFTIRLDDCLESNFNSLNSKYKRSSIKTASGLLKIHTVRLWGTHAFLWRSNPWRRCNLDAQPAHIKKSTKHNQCLTITYQQELAVILHMYIFKRNSLYSEVCVDDGVLVACD